MSVALRAPRRRGVSLVERPSRVEASLWRRLFFQRDEKCRQRLFRIHRNLAIVTARSQFRRRPAYGLERADFEQFAYEGLIESIDRYNPLRGVPFSAYARRRIIGAITDGLERSSEAGAQYGARRRAEAERVRSLRKSSKDPLSELSDLVMGLAIGVVLEGTGMIEPEDGICARPDAYVSLSWRQMETALEEEIARLPMSERLVVTEHYRHGVAFKEIAVLLGVTKGRVSQIHRAAVDRLKKRMSAFA